MTATPAAAASCEGSILDGSFVSAPVSGTVTDGQADCYPLSNVSVGQNLQLSLRYATQDGGPYWLIRDANDNTVCQGYFWSSGLCQLSGAPGWHLMVLNQSGQGSFSYSAAVRRLTNPSGCSALGTPAAWSFEGSRTDGAISAPQNAQCFTFSRTLGEADGRYWFRAVRSSGALSPRWAVYGPSGNEECGGGDNSAASACSLLGAGQYVLVVADSSETQSGTYFATAKRLSEPAGCGALSSLSFAAAATGGDISAAGQADCYSIPDVEAGDALSIAFHATSQTGGGSRWDVVDGAGAVACSSAYWYQTSCRLSGASGWSLLVYGEGTGTFNYQFAVRRLRDPEGCSSLGAPAAWSFDSPRINGSIPGSLAARCYTFSRQPEEADGFYWFRTERTAGAVNPQWDVYGPDGSRECTGNSNPATERCGLLAAGQFVFVVSDGAGQTGSYFATARRLNAPGGCGALSSVAFGAAPVAGEIASGGEADCYGIPGVVSGQKLSIGFSSSGVSGGSPRWTVVDGTGQAICDAQSYYQNICTLSGTNGWTMIAYDDGPGTLSYALAVRRLTSPQGCTPLATPGAWSYTAPRLDGTLNGPLDARCYTFTRQPGENDGAYWIRAARSSGGLYPTWQVFGPSGGVECTEGSFWPALPCELLSTGQFAFVVRPGSGEGAGSFYASLRQLNEPTGCTPVSSIAVGLPSTLGNLSAAGEADCYFLPAADEDIVKVETSGSANSFALMGPDGHVQCEVPSNCQLHGAGPYSLVVFASSGATGAYHFSLSCENPPCGQTDVAVTETLPSRVGQSRFASVLLRGHDLELLEGVDLRQDGAVVHGDLDPVAKNGRSVQVGFNLHAAAVGSWTLEAKFVGGVTRTLSAPVHVEAVHGPTITAQLLGRTVFRAGRASPITVEVSNSGNVDAIGVPVLLAGIPVGSTIEPQFKLQQPQGDISSISMVESSFDQSEDTLELDDGLAVPLFMPRIPAGRSVQLEFNITAPALGTNYELRASAGQCLVSSASTTAGPSTMKATRALVDDAFACALDVGGLVGDVIQNKYPLVAQGISCFNTGADIGTAMANYITLPLLAGVHDYQPVGAKDVFGFATDLAGCAVPGVAWVKKVMKFASPLVGLWNAGSDCWAAISSVRLPQQQVAAFDPNELVGPIGVGDAHYISGFQPVGYRVLFENKADATAPAQRVEITDQLDTSKFDPQTVLFDGFRFGSTSHVLAYPIGSVDETIDLRPEQNLQVRVTATTSPAGKIKIVLQAIDPDTLEPPTDPLAGFLPPNVDSPEGEGSIDFSVAARNLPSGSQLTNSAAIVFDANEPLDTGTWTNTIDKEAPSPTVAAAGTASESAEVSWGGTDDASGIGLWELEVSREGGPFKLWRTATAAGADEYLPASSGHYSFRATVLDRAGNQAQSSLAGVNLAPDGATQGGEGDGAGQTATLGGGPVPVPSTAVTRPKCRKGFKKKKVGKRTVCVKVKKRRHKHRKHFEQPAGGRR
jgi:hypothetical protein